MNLLKFRVWCKQYKYFIGPDQFGYLSYALRVNGALFADTPNHSYEINQEDYVVQRFTGILDKNDQEIFEGDKVLIPESQMCGPFVMEVYWKNASYYIKGFDPKAHHNFDWCLDQRTACAYEIVGNIFE